jgi:hypothetical protein
MAKYDIFEAAADPVFVLSAVLLVSSVSPSRLETSAQLILATRIDTCTNHASCLWRRIREVDFQDNQLVLCRLDPSVSLSCTGEMVS